MTSRLYFLLAFLPPLPPLGEAPPITFEQISRIVEQERLRDARVLVEALRFDFSLTRKVHLKLLGYSAGDTPGAFILDPAMPPVIVDLFMQDPQEMGEDVWLSRLWKAHLDFLDGLGKTLGANLLCRWSQWERALREQLAEARRPSPSATLPARKSPWGWDHSGLVAQWRSAPDPMAGERRLDEARIRFIDENSARYSFKIDELAAYFLKLGLLSRYARLSREQATKLLEEVTAL